MHWSRLPVHSINQLQTTHYIQELRQREREKGGAVSSHTVCQTLVEVVGHSGGADNAGDMWVWQSQVSMTKLSVAPSQKLHWDVNACMCGSPLVQPALREWQWWNMNTARHNVV